MSDTPVDSSLNAERESVRAELELLQLEELKFTMHRRRAQREDRERLRLSFEESLTSTRAILEGKQEMCPHRKGGKDLEGLDNGSSNNYSVIKHTLPHGAVDVICQRCQKVWSRPSAKDIHPETGKTVTLPQYKAALTEYKKALNFPTDNTPSGTRMFNVEVVAA